MKKLIAYFLFAIVLAFVVREFLYMGVKRNKIGEYDKLNTLFVKQNNYDALVIGSSRAESHFNIQIIDSVTGLNSFNAGLEGATMPFIEGGLKAYLNHSNAPKYIILNLDIHSMNDPVDTTHRFPRYFPYLNNEDLYTNLKQRDKRFPYFKWIPFYSLPYFNDRYLNAAARGWCGIESDYDKTFYKGFAPVPAEMIENLDSAKFQEYKIHPNEKVFQSIEAIIHIAKEKNSQLLFVISPVYHLKMKSLKNQAQLHSRINPLAEKNNIPIFNYAEDDVCNYKDLFADPAHLNLNGSILFSRHFAKDFKQYLSLETVY